MKGKRVRSVPMRGRVYDTEELWGLFWSPARPPRLTASGDIDPRSLEAPRRPLAPPRFAQAEHSNRGNGRSDHIGRCYDDVDLDDDEDDDDEQIRGRELLCVSSLFVGGSLSSLGSSLPNLF